MFKNMSILAILVIMLFTTDSYGETFLHPGILNSEENLNKLRHRYVNDQIPAAALSMLLDSQLGDVSRLYTPHKIVEVESHVSNSYEEAFRNDAHAARANALLWVMTDDKKYLSKAMRILDEWAVTFHAIKVTKGSSSQAYLEAAWALPIWISAAEIIRYYDGGKAKWSDKSIRQFDQFVLKLHSYSKKARKANNWGASATLSHIAVGVYLNNEAIFYEGIEWFEHSLKTLSTEDGALTADYIRDTWHPQYTLVAWIQTAEIAWNQGIDLYSLQFGREKKPRLEVVFEHFSKLFIGELGNPEGLKKGNYKNAHLNRPGYQIAFNHYINRSNRGEYLPALEKMVQYWYPGGFKDLFMSWDGLTHE